MEWCAPRDDGLRVMMDFAERRASRNDGLRVTMDSAYRWHGVFRVTMSRCALRYTFSRSPIGFAFFSGCTDDVHRSRRGRCVLDCYDKSHIGLLHPTDIIPRAYIFSRYGRMHAGSFDNAFWTMSGYSRITDMSCPVIAR